MTDSHWNSKGAFEAYLGFSKLFNLPTPEVNFQHGSTHKGDIISIAELEKYPLHPEDNWDIVWKKEPTWAEKEIPVDHQTPNGSVFGLTSIVTNQNPLSDKYVWVVGDSFSVSLRQYFNATFKEVHYIGHWSEKLKDLPVYLTKSNKKPDMIVIVRVERTF